MKRFLIAIILFGVAILILRRLAGLFAPASREPANGGRAAGVAEGIPLVRDKVCNTFLPKHRALELAGRDQVLYFCSEDCRRRFLSDVSRGIDAA